MITVKIPTKEDAAKVFLDEENYNRSADDFSPKREDFNIDVLCSNPDKLKVVGAYVDDKIASIMMEHDGMIHFMLLRKYRKYAHKIADELLKEFPGEIYTKVPSCYQSTLHFTKKHGFVEIGIDKASFTKNGQSYNEHILKRL